MNMNQLKVGMLNANQVDRTPIKLPMKMRTPGGNFFARNAPIGLENISVKVSIGE